MCRVLHLPTRVRDMNMTHNITSGLRAALNMLFTNTPRRHLVELSAAIGCTSARTREIMESPHVSETAQTTLGARVLQQNPVQIPTFCHQQGQFRTAEVKPCTQVST